jgi:UDP-N-acetylglucosamine--N-acetylmuramyl-(pentapeptide) pyrophosphoryl-undecaprenol N-acetylglucosamine transferase
VYPALAAAEAVQNHHPDAELFFVGTVGGFERTLIVESTVPFVAHDEVRAGPIHGVNPLRMITSAAKLLTGTAQAFRLLRRRQPQVILSTGGWVGLPVVVAAWLLRIPVVIFLPDIEPGLTIKALRRFAQKVALTVPESSQFFLEGQTVVTGYPLRESVREATREGGIAHFGLDEKRKTLLIFGGSRGSRAINIAVEDALADILSDDIQVIHITGTLDWERSQEKTSELKNQAHYHAYAYSHKIGLAFAAADLVVCRAGASILGEFPFFELPSILIPLAYSWHYQQVNADYLAERGAAIHLDEADMAQALLPTIRSLFTDAGCLKQMQTSIEQLAQPDGAMNLAQILVDFAQEKL